MIKIRTRKMFLGCKCFILFFILTILISNSLYANTDLKADNKNKKITNRIIILDCEKKSELLEVEPNMQYEVELRNVPFEKPIRMHGRYYDYVEGAYVGEFILEEYSRSKQGSTDNNNAKDKDIRRTALFSFYTIYKSYGYYSFRFFETDNLNDNFEKYMELLRTEREAGKNTDSSMIIPTCFKSTRIYLKGVQPTEIVNYDLSGSLLFEGGKAGTMGGLLLNVYPYTYLKSYKDAIKEPIWSRTSFSVSLVQANNKDDEKKWFAGVGIPLIFDIGLLCGWSFSDENIDASKLSIGLRMNSKLIEKLLNSVKDIKKNPEEN
ncbi:hypothetical protein ACFL57_04335 [Candidatus Margulisiibacteriota bacterium]